MLLSQLTASNLRRVFNVNPTEVWLRDDLDNTLFLPEDDGTFTQVEAGSSVLVVEGPSLTATSRASGFSSRPSSTTLSSLPSTSSLPPPSFRSVIAPKRCPSFTLKILKACVIMKNGRRKLDVGCDAKQTFIELVESTANLEHILPIVQKRWGPEYRIVTNDAIELEDSPATQGKINDIVIVALLFIYFSATGLSFWKCPRRKVYAVPLKNGEPLPRKRVLLDSDSDDDFIAPKMKKGRQMPSYTESMLESIQNDIADMKGSIADITTLSSKTKCPMALYRILRDTFQCKICRSVPMKPPVILMKCCKSIVGCDSCINNWFSGSSALTKSCPLCRAERGYSETMLIRGLDDFLEQVKVVVQTEDEQDDDVLPPINFNNLID